MPVTRQRIPWSTDQCPLPGRGRVRMRRALGGVRPLRGGCPGPRPKRRVPVAERTGDHAACAQAGYPLRSNGSPNPPTAVRQAKSGQVIMGRAVGSGRPVRSGARRGLRIVPGDHGACAQGRTPVTGNGFSRRSEGRRGRARQRGRPGGAGGHHGVRGDHGACAQGRMRVTRQRIPRIDGRRAPAEHGRCSWGVRPVRDAPDHQMRPGRHAEGAR